MKKNNNYLPIAIVIIIIIIIVVFLGNNMPMPKKPSVNLNSLGNKTFKSSCKYADVEYTTSLDAKTLNIIVHYKDLTGVSGIHIHVNKKGMPGPILAWLGTTKEWALGVAQNTPGSNAPCCTKNNPLCTLAAPKGTPDINNLSNTVMTFKVNNENCDNSCPWIENGTLLDVHGFNFQKVINGKLTSEKPSADMISNTQFVLVNN